MSASQQLLLGGVQAVEANYIEEVFSTWLYTSNGSTQTITNGIDLAGKGGLVWFKRRNAASNHRLYDTARGMTSAVGGAPYLYSNDTVGNLGTGFAGSVVATSSGFDITQGGIGDISDSGGTYASWTFRKQPKFFDVVTYTGTQNSSGTGQVVNHNLGSTPGCIIIKPLSDTSGSGFSGLNNWIVYHRGLSSPTTQYLRLNTTDAIDGNSDKVRAVSDTTFTAGWEVGLSGIQYVAYVFAHNAGGFGLSGEDNVISCGSFTYSAGTTVDLGYEPQAVLFKVSNTNGNWFWVDNMRGWTTDGNGPLLSPNTSGAEGAFAAVGIAPTATGFRVPSGFGNGNTIIYIAIRRGPMRVPTTGTSVFSPNTQTGANTTAGQTITTNFPVDLEISSGRSDNSGGNAFVDRLRGGQNYIQATNTNAEVNFTSWTPLIGFANNTGITDANYGSTSASYVAWNFRRAPGFFDEVCYTGTGASRLINHNLGVPPELIITKRRNAASTLGWIVSSQYWFASTPWDRNGRLNQTNALEGGGVYIPASSHSATQYPVDGDFEDINASGSTYVAYLFASCPGVSKVGSYTGNGSSQTINCGFTGGARFVMVKRTDSTGNWMVVDTARGLVSAGDPTLYLNSTAAEVTGVDWLDPDSSGFIVNQEGTMNANVNGGTYIFLAIS